MLSRVLFLHASSTLCFQTSECSADEIRAVIAAVQPQTVMLELCPSRYAAMFPKRKEDAASATAGPACSPPIDVSLPVRHVAGADCVRAEDVAEDAQQSEVQLKREELAQSTQMVDTALRAVYTLLGSAGLTPGCDFVAAVDAARLVGAQLVLGDRDAFITMEHIAGLRDLREAFNTEQIFLGARQLADSVTPASDGRVRPLTVLLQPRRIREALPVLLLLLGALGASAALAWSTESLLGVSR